MNASSRLESPRKLLESRQSTSRKEAVLLTAPWEQAPRQTTCTAFWGAHLCKRKWGCLAEAGSRQTAVETPFSVKERGEAGG